MKATETELDAFQAQLNAFAAVFSKNRSLRQYLMNPQRTTSEKVQWLASDTSELFARFILTVLQTSGAKKVSAIAEKLIDDSIKTRLELFRKSLTRN
jgi:F0F1-type ATP synthase delta subunit